MSYEEYKNLMLSKGWLPRPRADWEAHKEKTLANQAKGEKLSHERLYALAHAAGCAAADRCRPAPMVVFEPGSPFGPDESDITKAKHVYPPVMEGVCGFAWIVIRPGTCSFARWLAKTGRGKKAYEGGIQVWVSQYGQSMQRKEAYARAFAAALNGHGVKAYAQSRMD